MDEGRVDFTSLKDEDLIRSIADARAEALSELYDRYSRLVFSLAVNVVGDMALAEEITQDVFLRIWEKAGTYREDQAKVSTWLTSITRYRAIDVLRRLDVRPEGHSVRWADLNPSQTPRSDGRKPEEASHHNLLMDHVRDAIANLPPEQQEALALAYFGGLSHSEISEKLEQPLGTVKTRIRLAMQKLRLWMREENVLG
jgi:RNA polymerase sigma-70 factor (ECF subfamily)